MWEAKAADGCTDALLTWLIGVAPQAAQVYRSADRVVLIAEGLDAVADPPEELISRPAYAWSFERVR